jgi:hypothetical protein
MVDIVEAILFASLAVLGIIGGLPHLVQWLVRRPSLEILDASIELQSANNFQYHAHLVVANRRRWWHRSGDASNVIAEYYLIDKDHVQKGFVSGQLVTPFLLIGTKAVKDAESYHSLPPEGGPYSIVFRVTCSEGAEAKRLIPYDIS